MKCRLFCVEKEIGNITSARISLCENWENVLKLDSIFRASHTWFIQCFTLRRGNIRLSVLNILGNFIPSTDFKPHPNANLIFFHYTQVQNLRSNSKIFSSFIRRCEKKTQCLFLRRRRRRRWKRNPKRPTAKTIRPNRAQTTLIRASDRLGRG